MNEEKESQQLDLVKKRHTCTVICPSVEFLEKSEIITNVECTVNGCDEVFSQISALNLHLEKVHKIFNKDEKDEILCTRAMSKSQKIKENCECKYHCPKLECKYNVKGDRSLPTFHSLKNHFIRMHGIKSFKCSKCFKEFSIKSEMERHEISCGKMFKCSQCGIGYSTLSSLHKHIKKKNHFNEDIKKNIKNDLQNKLPLSKNETKPTANELRSVHPVIILPNNIINTSLIIIPCSSTNQTSNRALECQTIKESSLNNTQETGSQTVNNINQSFGIQFNSSIDLLQDINSYSQESSKIQKQIKVDVLAETNSNNSHEYDYLDAATSTSPFIDLEMLLNNSSTQTQQSYFTNNCSIQTNEIEEENHNSGYFCSELANIHDYFYYSQENNRPLDKTCQTHRCITPSNTIVSTYASSQTDEMYFYNYQSSQQINNSNTNSIQTQTYNIETIPNFNVVQTQTDFCFN